jgi:hypothetical protein
MQIILTRSVVVKREAVCACLTSYVKVEPAESGDLLQWDRVRSGRSDTGTSQTDGRLGN